MRLAEWRRTWRSAHDSDAYAWNGMMEKCADQETQVGKYICDVAQREYERNRAGLISRVRVSRERAADVCKPEELVFNPEAQ